MIAFGPDICRDWSRATSREWLETNGLGGFASSTIAWANTRRYHGLLVAALRPPTRRTVLLSKLEETLAVREVEYDLSCNQYPGAIHPQGYRHLSEFRLDPFPTFIYEVPGGARLEKAVGMCRGLNAVIVRYRLIEGPERAGLIVRPLVNCRDYHHLTRQNATFNTEAAISEAQDVVTVQPFAEVPALRISFPGGSFEPWGNWYNNFEYAQELARGLDYREDQYSPGYFTCALERGETRYLVGSIEALEGFDPAAALEEERARRSAPAAGWSGASEEVRQLVEAADSFIVSQRAGSEGDGGQGIIAGYHWFEEWGRDTMISLPGLTLVTGRYDTAKRILGEYAGYLEGGLIPNRIPEMGAEPDYNTVDATLWLFWAVQKYLEHTGDEDFVREGMLPRLREVLDWYARGTRYGIEMDPEDGLLRAGSPGTQLTWMDAKVGDWVVTPRHGKPVEVNALWHNALRFVEELGAEHAGPRSSEVARRFGERFWNERLGYLNDVVDGDLREDASLRPNQIVAASLPYPTVEGERARRVVAAVARDLLTPYGLRTLSPRDARYRGRYEGDQWERDGAYHQGTVWPWLLGPFITAFIRVAEDREAARREARGWVAGFREHLREAGLGQVSEVFDGDPPHRARGCIAQAWSVAEILRAAVEDLDLSETAA